MDNTDNTDIAKKCNKKYTIHHKGKIYYSYCLLDKGHLENLENNCLEHKVRFPDEMYNNWQPYIYFDDREGSNIGFFR